MLEIKELFDMLTLEWLTHTAVPLSSLPIKVEFAISSLSVTSDMLNMHPLNSRSEIRTESILFRINLEDLSQKIVVPLEFVSFEISSNLWASASLSSASKMCVPGKRMRETLEFKY